MALAGEVQNYRKKIKQLEDDLLFRLSNSQACRQWLSPHTVLLAHVQQGIP